ncbi:MAG TPA: NifB/NifX family molybdenum-iron cluster-binding protein [Bacteroidales bacterium]|nr:NifB/NifX family molybdenum-iron cluster-binding protein [Bacteroidales bacterium]HRZ76836.1 NifB/NifX family molybdenum-iron cluster-binding protein [Bacteroidales bacterium]
MKKAITATRADIHGRFDRRFGRSPWFFVWDTSTGEGRFVPNPGSNAETESGTVASQALVELGVKQVFSGDFGPGASQQLQASGISLFLLRDDRRHLSEILHVKKHPLTIL